MYTEIPYAYAHIDPYEYTHTYIYMSSHIPMYLSTYFLEYNVESPQAPTSWPRTTSASGPGEVGVVETFLSATWYDFTPTGQRGKWYEKKYSLTFDCAFYLNRDTSVLKLFPVVAFQ